MENKFYIALILTLAVTLLGYFFDYFGELVFWLFPFFAFIYMAFSFDMPRKDFNLMWLVLVFPHVFFFLGSSSSFFFTFFYSLIYPGILILFNIQKRGEPEDKNSLKNWSIGKRVAVIVFGVLGGIALLSFFLWVMFGPNTNW